MASTDQALSSKDDDQTEVTPTEKDEDDDEMQANNEQGSVDDDDDDSEDDRVPTPPGPIPEGIDKDVWKELKRVDNVRQSYVVLTRHGLINGLKQAQSDPVRRIVLERSSSEQHCIDWQRREVETP